MSDVIDFPWVNPADQIWVCGCGCRSFELRGDGVAACAACDSPVQEDTGGWFDLIVDAGDWSADKPIFRDLDGGDTSDFARAQLARAAADPSARAIVVVWQGSRVTSWLNATDKKELDELSELIDSYKHMTGIKTEGSE